MSNEINRVLKTAKGEGANDLFAKIIVAQLMHESANFTSNVYKKNNNANGMKYPSVRKSPYIAGKGTQPPGNEGKTPYARFNSLEDNVKDLFLWLKANGINHETVDSIETYTEQLRKRSYMGNTQTGKRIYIAGLTNNFKKAFGSTVGTAAQSSGINIGKAASKNTGLIIIAIVCVIGFYLLSTNLVKI